MSSIALQQDRSLSLQNCLCKVQNIPFLCKTEIGIRTMYHSSMAEASTPAYDMGEGT